MLFFLVIFLLFGTHLFLMGYIVYSFGITTVNNPSASRRIQCLQPLMLLTPGLYYWGESFSSYYHEKEDFNPTTLAVWSFLLFFGYASVMKLIRISVEDERLERLERMILERTENANAA